MNPEVYVYDGTFDLVFFNCTGNIFETIMLHTEQPTTTPNAWKYFVFKISIAYVRKRNPKKKAKILKTYNHTHATRGLPNAR